MQQILESTLSYWWRTEPTRCSAGQSAEVRAGSESRANAHWGSPGTWEALSFPCLTSNQPAGAGRSIPRPTDARVHRPLGAKQWTEVRYRVARETEASGTSDSGQSILMVPVKQGNPPQGSLWREGGCREAFHSARAGWIHEPWRGKMSGPSKPGSVSTKLLRIAELARQTPSVLPRPAGT